MTVQVQPSILQGTVCAPASKSSMQRACAAALIKTGTSILHNPGKSNDDLAALDVIQKLGATVKANEDGTLTINSNGVQPVSKEINCGESGLGIRMFTPIAALSSGPITINGKGSLVTRPMNFFDEIFPQLSIDISSNQGKLPLKIKGPLTPADIEVDGSLSSQFLTGLLMAFSASIKEQATITVRDLKSKPYIALTLSVMEDFGLNAPQNNNFESFTFSPSNNKPTTVEYTVEGDWSGGAFLLVAGAVAGNISVKGLDKDSTQADKAILKALEDCGCNMKVEKNVIDISTADLKPFHFDATDCPDLFPPLVSLAAYCNGISTIEGVGRLTHKESNRALTLREEFGKLGVSIQLEGDRMLVNGGGLLNGATVHSHHDHRIAMACAVAALKAAGDVVIEEADAINKSYPDFYKHLQDLGATVHY